MKACEKCGSTENSFRKSKRKEDGLDNWCKVCRRQSDKVCYNNHLDKNRREGNKRKQIARLRNRQFVIDYLSEHPCIDCGEADPIVLEFDHRADKDKNISTLISDCSIDKLQEEISKCDVRCANCHRRKTAKDFKYYKMIM